ncbi:MAG: hypothetical protein KAI07_02445 [Deltaproteobacteria bacterium]|nr:hypothetical protein [Deltaproteobacteria bacterium]
MPEHLKEHAWLFPAYVDNEYNVRGQYRGIVGWYAEDTADLHPPTTKELGEVFIQGFDGTDQLIAAASNAYSEKKYNLTAKLLSYVIAVEPDNMKARQFKSGCTAHNGADDPCWHSDTQLYADTCFAFGGQAGLDSAFAD